jgi:hypothetical protein
MINSEKENNYQLFAYNFKSNKNALQLSQRMGLQRIGSVDQIPEKIRIPNKTGRVFFPPRLPGSSLIFDRQDSSIGEKRRSYHNFGAEIARYAQGELVCESHWERVRTCCRVSVKEGWVANSEIAT